MNALHTLPSLCAAWTALVVPLHAALPGGGTALDRATQAFQDGQFAQVLEIAAAPDAPESERPRLLYLAGEAQLVLGAPAEAEKAFRGVLAARPGAVPAQVGLGRALTALLRFDEAQEPLAAALKIDAKDVGALAAHGLLLSNVGKPEEAKAELERAWKLDPKNALTVRSYVEVLLRADDVPGAAAIAEAFAEARPEHPLGPFLLAWTMERDGEDEQAIERYREALARDPDFIDAHKNLAILCHTLSSTYRDKERVEAAYQHYERYFALGGKDEELRRMHADLLAFKEQIMGM